MHIGSYLVNRKWSHYMENMDSSGVKYHLVHFWSNLQLSSEKMLTDAQHFVYVVYSRLRRHFALGAIVFLVNIFDSWTPND